MLDTNTKRNIDAARNVLVGKVPDPKAQVEQITTALIYKFMDDLDKESVELGGEDKFFTGDFEKYSWTKVIDTRLTGEGRLDLYVQAITSMTRNPNLPQLFRDIFKDAFLPYRDPQTLSLFLKEINKFTYDHSEELGNAFEYLLSVLGSQGDAGQFRTPRHIIDFTVEVVDPRKNDTILDPACGTAGFLVSAYKHIRKYNSSNYMPEKDTESVVGDTAAEMILQEKKVYRGDKLTPTERKKLTENIQGYDISPDMVRLSLVNLYLHGFTSPKIFEYDTLSSEKRWGETFDVILANPPFMTPKGGIRPHKRFQVQASRSEVLFVDYILEHMNINGRAGIIVPEGIIFKTETAYKRLRQLLVEDGLFAVVSLPPGVFNPYSGVKTSILFFDNQVAKKTDEILFIKIENDGFGLGAQRRKINKDDLPKALKILRAWKKGKTQEDKLAQWVKKEKIAEDGDYNLTGERYREVEIFTNENWPMVELGEALSLEYGKPLKKANRKGGEFPVFGSNGIVGYHDEYLVEGPFIIVGRKGSAGEVTFSEKSGFPIDTTFYVRLHNEDKVNLKYIYHILNTLELDKVNTQAGVPGLNRNDAYKIQVPIPPKDVQDSIVAQIEVKQAAIDGAKAVIENLEKERRYFGHELKKIEKVEWMELGEIAEFVYGYTDSAKDTGEVRFIRITDIDHFGKLNPNEQKFIELTDEAKKYILRKNDVLVARTGATYGKTMLFDQDYPAVFASYLIRITFTTNQLDPYFYWLFTRSNSYWEQAEKLRSGGGQPQFNANAIKKLKVPILPMENQKIIIAKIEGEEEIIAANKRLIELMEKKIEMVLEEI